MALSSFLAAFVKPSRNTLSGARPFTARYGLGRLVHAEWHEDIREAIRREKAIKGWRRAWKVRLVLAGNPGWEDLFGRLGGGV